MTSHVEDSSSRTISEVRIFTDEYLELPLEYYRWDPILVRRLNLNRDIVEVDKQEKRDFDIGTSSRGKGIRQWLHNSNFGEPSILTDADIVMLRGEVIFLPRSGLRFPLPALITDYLRDWGFGLCQIAPNTWKRIIGLMVLLKERGWEMPTAEEIRSLFTFRRCADRQVADPLICYACAGKPQGGLKIGDLITEVPDSLHGFQEEWLWVGGDWQTPNFSKPQCIFAELKRRISELFKLKKGQRSFKLVLKDTRLKAAGLCPEISDACFQPVYYPLLGVLGFKTIRDAQAFRQKSPNLDLRTKVGKSKEQRLSEMGRKKLIKAFLANPIMNPKEIDVGEGATSVAAAEVTQPNFLSVATSGPIEAIAATAVIGSPEVEPATEIIQPEAPSTVEVVVIEPEDNRNVVEEHEVPLTRQRKRRADGVPAVEGRTKKRHDIGRQEGKKKEPLVDRSFLLID
ncbi:myosin heavy chain-related [Striga asiatica]|uniref:Myosin heavy chain-related n=1 Tax=Striga asiatica TaxID=4170 RepID=A0A5A7PKT2_STRAF|nr:myosin heavy chain-related [Striga asiatica]